MPLPCPMCGSWEAYWSEPEPAGENPFKTLFRPFEAFIQVCNPFYRFGHKRLRHSETQPLGSLQPMAGRSIKKWSCPACGKSGEQTA